LHVRCASPVLALLLATACSSSETQSPAGMIPDAQAQRIVTAAFAAHGRWEDFVTAETLSFEAKASGPVTSELGDLMMGYVELASQPRSRWATHRGTIDIGRHGEIEWQTPTLKSQVSKETAMLLDLTGLFLAMPMPLAQSSAPPTYAGLREIDHEDWDLLTLVPSEMGIDLRKLEVYVRRSTGRVEMLCADLGDNRPRWIRGFAPRQAYKLRVFGEVRWYTQTANGEPAGDPAFTLALGELRSRPAWQAFRRYVSTAVQ